MPVTRIQDAKRVFASIALEPERSAILGAFLGTFGPGDGAWAWRAGGATNISFVVHLTRSPHSPILFGYGPPAGIENLLAAALPELPPRVSLHFPVGDREALERAFTLEATPHTVMSLVPEDLFAADPRVRAVKPSELERDEVAPVVAREYRRAFIGRDAARAAGGRAGDAAALHVALARRLFDEGIEVIGTVAPDQDGAGRALLASIGYLARGHVLVGAGVVRGRRAAGGPPPAAGAARPAPAGADRNAALPADRAP